MLLPKDVFESPISDTYFNFSILSLWNLLLHFQIWCWLPWTQLLADLRMEPEDSTNFLEQNQSSMNCIADCGVIFRHLFMGSRDEKLKKQKKIPKYTNIISPRIGCNCVQKKSRLFWNHTIWIYGRLPIGNFVYLTRWRGQLMSVCAGHFLP